MGRSPGFCGSAGFVVRRGAGGGAFTCRPACPFARRISFPTSAPRRRRHRSCAGPAAPQLRVRRRDEAFRRRNESIQLCDGLLGEALSYNQPLWYNESVDKARAVLARLAPTGRAPGQGADRAREGVSRRGGAPVRRRRQSGARSAYADSMPRSAAIFPTTRMPRRFTRWRCSRRCRPAIATPPCR